MYVLKCILIGASSIGKSSLYLRYLCDRYITEYQPTVGVDFGEKIIRYDDDEYKIQIWDTAGQERFDSVTKAFYRNTNCVLYCFSLTSRESFNRAQRYITSFRQMIPENTSVLEILVGLCSDLPQTISEEDIRTFKRDNDLDIYFPVSAKNNINVDRLFKTILKNAKDYCVKKEVKRNKYIEQLEVMDSKQEKENDSCCVPDTHYNYQHAYHNSFYL